MSPGEGHSTFFFQVGVCGPDFRSVGLANWPRGTDICLWKGGSANWKFPNLGACELKVSKFGSLWAEISKFGGLRAKIWAKIEAAEAKNFQIFSKGCLVIWLFCLKWDPCRLQERREKGGLQGYTSPYPLSRSVPPGGCPYLYTSSKFRVIWHSVLIIQRGVTTTPLRKMCLEKPLRITRVKALGIQLSVKPTKVVFVTRLIKRGGGLLLQPLL